MTSSNQNRSPDLDDYVILDEFLKKCRSFRLKAHKLEKKSLNFFLKNVCLIPSKIDRSYLDYDLTGLVKEVEVICKGFREVQDMYDTHLLNAVTSVDLITLCRVRQSYLLISKSRTSLCYLINRFIVYALPKHEVIKPILFLARIHDDELLHTSCRNDCKASDLCSNTCPILIRPLRHLSLARLLSFVARGQSDVCGKKLVSTLLKSYTIDLKFNVSSEEGSISEGSHATSIEICKDLTRNVTPPLPPVSMDKNYGKPYPLLFPDSKYFIPSFDIYYLSKQEITEQALVEKFLKDSAILENCGHEMNIKGSLCTDEITEKICEDSLLRAAKYFSQHLWGEVSSVIDSVMLWWTDSQNEIESLLDIEQVISGGAEDFPLAIHSPEASLRFRDWLQDFITTYESSSQLPGVMAAAVQSLCDGVSSHIMTVAWDHSFRMALVQPDSSHEVEQCGNEKGTYTGRLFVEVLRRLVSLSNDWEDRGVLEVSEIKSVSSQNLSKEQDKYRKEGAYSFASDQIPVLHRLDHSLHTLRMWVQAYARKAASTWNALSFFHAAHSDVMSAMEVLNMLRLPDYEKISDVENVNMTVCVKMRSKLVSEVKANIVKLQNLPAECLNVLAMMGRTISLATLCLCMPDPRYWRRQSHALPEFPSPYVEEYLDKILKPVIKAVQNLDLPVQQSAAGMVLRILGEAWLDHIYQHRIKFSEWGALQLLTDFGSVQNWLEERITLSPELHRHLAQTEVLRRCEGVGRLLLRHPGEAISMIPPSLPTPAHYQKGSVNSSDVSPMSNTGGRGALMPAEMYVPNQEQWLELRASGVRDYCRSCCYPCWSPMFCAICLLSCR